MPNLPDKNHPDTWTHNRTLLSHITYDFNLGLGDVQKGYITPHKYSRPISFVFSDYSKAKLEVTTSSIDKVKDGTALWATITLNGNFHGISTPITAMRLTGQSGPVNVSVCI